MTKAIQIKDLKIGTGIPKVCVPLTSEDAEGLKKEAKIVKDAKPDLVEWRGDFFEHLQCPEKCAAMAEELAGILEEIPLLFTIRTDAEGGNAAISMEEYAKINLAVAASGMVDLVDVESFGNEEEKRNLIQKLKETKVKVIASSHDFEKTDAKEILLNRFQKMNETGADILKIAVMPKCAEDVEAIMQATKEMKENFTEKPLVSMSMGELGVRSRVEGEIFGSSITFATVGKASAPGQIPIEELRMKMLKIYQKRSKSHEKF